MGETAATRAEYDVSMTGGGGSPALPRGILMLVGLAAAVIVLGGMRAMSDILGSLFLALVLTIVAHPMRRRLERHMPSWVGSLICIVVVYAGMLALALSIVVSAARFAALLPTYEDEFKQRMDDLTSWLSDMGVDQSQIDKIGSSFDLSQLSGVIESLLGGLLSVTTSLFFILTLVLFMTMDGGSFTRLLTKTREARPGIIEALGDFAHGTRRYLAVSTIFGFIVAVLDTIALAMLGVPLPVTWGLLAFITNYIPNIGFVIGLIPPAVLALLEGGPSLMLAVIAVYCLLNVVIQTVIQPKVVGDSVGLSTTLTFVSLVVWAWVLGALGALLAIPITLLVKAILVDSDPSLRWLRPLISNKDDESPADEAPAT